MPDSKTIFLGVFGLSKELGLDTDLICFCPGSSTTTLAQGSQSLNLKGFSVSKHLQLSRAHDGDMSSSPE